MRKERQNILCRIVRYSRRQEVWIVADMEETVLEHIHTAIYKIETNKDLLYSTGNSAVFCNVYMGKVSKERVGVCIVSDSLCCAIESNTAIVNQLYSVKIEEEKLNGLEQKQAEWKLGTNTQKK